MALWTEEEIRKYNPIQYEPLQRVYDGVPATDPKKRAGLMLGLLNLRPEECQALTTQPEHRALQLLELMFVESHKRGLLRPQNGKFVTSK